MLPLLTCDEMRQTERAALERGIPGRVLMENAATFALSVILEMAPSFVPVFCGKGGNAGDGFALARRLFVRGIRTEIVLCCPADAPLGDAAENLSAARALGVPISTFSDFCARAEMPAGTAIVDALLGIGLRGEVRAPLSEVIRFLNESGFPIVSLDIPSGISALSGRVLGCAVRAAKTVTFGHRKIGLYSPLSLPFVGEILCDDISIPAPASPTRFLMEKEDVRLAPLSPSAHKGMRGHAAILGGSAGMAGAVLLATKGAEMAGAGLVTAMVPPALLPIMMMRLWGAMCADSSAPIPEKANAVLVGPGLGRGEDGYRIFKKALEAARDTLVIDADGLYHLAKDPSMVKGAAKNIILTPHFGEMSRLCGLSTEEISERRVCIAEEFAAKYGVTLVLKGPHTVVAEQDGRTYINTTGNAGMAKGGSGDILAGVILGLAAQGIESAAERGVYLHGLAGDMAAAEIGARGMCADNVANFLPKAIKCM